MYRQTHLLSPALAEATVHTTNSLTRDQLIGVGIPPESIRVIPLGVDVARFQQQPSRRETIRRRYNIDPRTYVIGSFQKDGVGWGDGNEPKHIKGPDTLVETIGLIARELPVHVLLSGPARGYVIEELKARRIPHTYVGYKQDKNEVTAFYQALDLYLITSRVEGGPLQFLEAWAAGVPLVATPVGMIRDTAKNEYNCMLAAIGKSEQLASAAMTLLRDKNLASRLREQAHQDVAAFDWSVIAGRYLTELYQPNRVPG